MNYFTKKILFLLLLIVLLQFTVYAQKKDSTGVQNKTIKNGFSTPFIYLGLSVGASAYIDLSLITGVQITERINLGFAGKYQYYSLGGSPSTGFSTHIYGGSIYLQTAIIKDFRNIIKKVKSHNGIYIHAEYELLSLNETYFELTTSESNVDNRFWLNNIIVGPGYINHFNRSSISAHPGKGFKQPALKCRRWACTLSEP